MPAWVTHLAFDDAVNIYTARPLAIAEVLHTIPPNSQSALYIKEGASAVKEFLIKFVIASTAEAQRGYPSTR